MKPVDECQPVKDDIVRARRDAKFIKLFVAPDATAADLAAIRDELSRIAIVEGVEYVSKDEALERAKQLFAESPGVMENLTGNPFPAVFEVRVASINDTKAVTDALGDNPAVSGVATGGENATKFLTGVLDGTSGMSCEEYAAYSDDEPAGDR